jgi:hypothetical protein
MQLGALLPPQALALPGLRELALIHIDEGEAIPVLPAPLAEALQQLTNLSLKCKAVGEIDSAFDIQLAALSLISTLQTLALCEWFQLPLVDGERAVLQHSALPRVEIHVPRKHAEDVIDLLGDAAVEMQLV